MGHAHDKNGIDVNNKCTTGGALLVSDFEVEAAKGGTLNTSMGIFFGRNPDIDVGTAEDVWGGGGDYTGFNATGNENISVVSSDVNDTGSVLESGTASSGSRTSLGDTSATFVTNSVSVGDILLNDTQGIHGIITSVTETELTFSQMNGGNPVTRYQNNSGDTYRVVEATSTGAAVVKISLLQDEDNVPQTDAFVVLNGTTPVTLTGNYMRGRRGQILLAGSSGGNEGTITANQSVTTANVFFVMPAGFNQTVIAAFTVPAGKVAIIRRLRVSITRSNGSAGSATIDILARPPGEVFRALRVFEVQNGPGTPVENLGGDILPPGTDVKARVESVSDNNTISEAAFEVLFEDQE